MRYFIISIFILLSGCADYEQLSEDFCSDKGGVKGYSVRWGFNVVHCNDGHFSMFEDL